MNFEIAAKYDVIVIGSGISGLLCAIELAKHGKSVCMLSKEAITEGSSLYAQGGIAVPLGDFDSVEKHLEDTVKAGTDLVNYSVAKEIISNAKSAFNKLTSYGIKFDLDTNNQIHLTREAAHSVPRVSHIGGDSSGRYITQLLVDKACREQNISISQGTIALSIVDLKCNGPLGVLVEDVNSSHYLLAASDVIIATGGVGQVYKHTSNPIVSTGDGVSMAYAAGAELQDLEMIQFHPTVLLEGGDPFLITEALRGEGARLKNINGEYFANKYHPSAELSPRDVLSRAIFYELEKTNSKHVYLDVSNFMVDYFKNRFPSVYQSCVDRKINLFKSGIPVVPAAHYFIGGIKCDVSGQTSMPHLWCIGECASNGFNGANRLASNSLLECIVVPYILVDKLLEHSQVSVLKDSVEFTDIDLNDYGDEQVFSVLSELKNMNSTNMGLIRNEDNLSKHFLWLSKQADLFNVKRTSLNSKHAELKNMILLSSLMCKAALERKHSLGVHFRADYPHSPEEFKHSIFHQKHGFSLVSAEEKTYTLSNF